MVNSKSVKELRGFLGLTGYYRKFIRGYGIISRPLTDQLKENSFSWNSEAQEAFDQLKIATSQAPVLSLPDFSKPFTIETDASKDGIGAVLMQNKRPSAFLSKKLGVKSRGLSTYEKELLALLTAVTKWRHYVIGGIFVIKTDQISLNHLLEQMINTAMQHNRLSKLLGLDYRVEYKKGIENKVVDVLSRREEQDIIEFTDLTAFSELVPSWVQDIQDIYLGDTWIEGLKKKLDDGADNQTKLSIH